MTDEQAAPESNGQVKDFGSVTVDEGPSFALAGQTFRTKGSMPPKALLNASTDNALDTLVDFISSLIVKDDRDRFVALINDPDAPINIEQLGEISSWIVEQQSNGRPTNA